MMTEVLGAFLRANIVGGLAILAVLALRSPMRRAFGPQVAYGLWSLPPVAFVATLMPPPVLQDEPAVNPLAVALADHSLPTFAAWGAGFAATIAFLAWAQWRFVAAARAGRAGPSVVGFIAPRIVMPADDGRYTPEERDLIRAHERQHIERGDPRAGALAAAFQALCWFNPLVHVAAHAMRLDQELACDAAVLARRPRDRALYAKTLLKTQLATQALPFGCHWPARGPHPLEVRVGLLRSQAWHDGMVGHLLLAVGLVTVALAAWNAQPPGEKHPPPMIAFLEARGSPTVSVMLITWPPVTAAQP
jgi:beta-lactamase regulating signal transducer with metallopeptidase domain